MTVEPGRLPRKLDRGHEEARQAARSMFAKLVKSPPLSWSHQPVEPSAGGSWLFMPPETEQTAWDPHRHTVVLKVGSDGVPVYDDVTCQLFALIKEHEARGRSGRRYRPADAIGTPGEQDEQQPLHGWIALPEGVVQVLTPADLAVLLKTAMNCAGLTAGQVATKTGISRSQVYSLINAQRQAIPRKGEQLRAFMSACRMRPADMNIVMRCWRELRELRSSGRPPVLPPFVVHGELANEVLFFTDVVLAENSSAEAQTGPTTVDVPEAEEPGWSCWRPTVWGTGAAALASALVVLVVVLMAV